MNDAKAYKWCAVDAEGDVGNRGLLGVAVYSDYFTGYLTDHDAIIAVLVDHARSGCVFLCHNASYDIPVIWGQLGLRPEQTYYNGRLHHGSWRYKKGAAMAQIWDTLDLSGGIGLIELGDAIGYPKYKTPKRLLGEDPDRYDWVCETHGRGECIECYAVRDAEIVFRFMSGLTTQLEGWNVQPAPRLAGIAVDTWRAFDRPEPISLPDKKHGRLARAAYAGGRVETFKLGYISPLYTADVTSMYPSVMLETAYPDPARMVLLTNPPVNNFPWDSEGVARCDVSIPPMYCPPLPSLHKGERTFPIGRVVGTWTLLELRHAIAAGCRVNSIEKASVSLGTLHPFTAFVTGLWKLRAEYKAKGDPRALFVKLLLNNLYGRLGVRERTERTIIRPAPRNWDSRVARNWNSSQVGDHLFIYRTDELTFTSDWTNVLWAAYTTAAARVKLRTLMLLQGENLVYCDTDSIFSRAPILGTTEGLGGLSPDGDFRAGIIARPKFYALQDHNGEWHAKAKGVPRNLALQFLRDGEVTFDKAIKAKESLTRHIDAGSWIDATRTFRTRAHRRQPLNPDHLEWERGWSDTAPPVHGPLPHF